MALQKNAEIFRLLLQRQLDSLAAVIPNKVRDPIL